MQQKEQLSEFPRFQGFDPSVIERSSPPNRSLLRRRHSTKLIERSDFIDSTFQPPVQASPTKQGEQALDASDSTDPLDPIHPIQKKKLQRRKSDSSIIAQYYRNFDELPADLPRSSRLRRNQPEKLNTSNLGPNINNSQAPMSCPSKNATASTAFDDILRIKETFEDNRPTSLRRPSKARRQLCVDEFDDTPKINTDKRGNSDGENSRDGIKEWETSPRKSDLHRSLRNQDIDAF